MNMPGTGHTETMTAVSNGWISVFTIHGALKHTKMMASFRIHGLNCLKPIAAMIVNHFTMPSICR
jgi:hypothetical protein